jgi:hypothetical protein
MAIFATKKVTVSTSKKGVRVTPKASTTKTTKVTKARKATKKKR